MQLLKDISKFLRLKYQTTSLIIIFGYIINPESNISYIPILILTLISFVIFYSGVYVFNDLVDFESDKKNPKKQLSPLVQGKISFRNASIISIILIFTGLITLTLINPLNLLIGSLFLGINLFYSLVAKKIPYLELLVNSTTYPLRLVLGYVVVGGTLNDPLIIQCVVLAFLTALPVNTTKRKLEFQTSKKVRPTLKFYTLKRLNYINYFSLSLTVILSITVFNSNHILNIISLIIQLLNIISPKSYIKSISWNWKT